MAADGRAAGGGRRRAARPSCGRLLDLHDAYALADRADDARRRGSPRGRRRALRRAAAEAAPANVELGFWAGLGIAAAGDVDAGAARVRAAIDAHGGLGATCSPASSPRSPPRSAAVRAALGVPRASLADHLDDDGALARAVVEVDQDQLLPGAEREAAAVTGTTSEAPTSEARWWACEFESWLRRLCS